MDTREADRLLEEVERGDHRARLALIAFETARDRRLRLDAFDALVSAVEETSEHAAELRSFVLGHVQP